MEVIPVTPGSVEGRDGRIAHQARHRRALKRNRIDELRVLCERNILAVNTDSHLIFQQGSMQDYKTIQAHTCRDMHIEINPYRQSVPIQACTGQGTPIRACNSRKNQWDRGTIVETRVRAISDTPFTTPTPYCASKRACPANRGGPTVPPGTTGGQIFRNPKKHPIRPHKWCWWPQDIILAPFGVGACVR